MTRATTPSWWRSGRGDQEALFAAGWHALTSEPGNDASIAQARKEAASAILCADGDRYALWLEVEQARPAAPVDLLMADRLRLASRELATLLVLVASGRVAASEAYLVPIAALIREDERARISLLPGSAPLPDPPDIAPPPDFEATAHGSELSPRAQSYVDRVRPYFSGTVRMYRWLLQELQSDSTFQTEENEAEAVIHFEFVYGLRRDWMLLAEELQPLRKPAYAVEMLTFMRHSTWLITAMGVTSPRDLWSMETIDGLIALGGLGDWVDE